MIPLFNKYRIIGEESKDYKDFVLAAEIMKKKDHLTLEGLEQIRTVKSRMNRARYKDVTNAIRNKIYFALWYMIHCFIKQVRVGVLSNQKYTTPIYLKYPYFLF